MPLFARVHFQKSHVNPYSTASFLEGSYCILPYLAEGGNISRMACICSFQIGAKSADILRKHLLGYCVCHIWSGTFFRDEKFLLVTKNFRG